MYTARGTTDKSYLIQQHSGLVKKIAGILKARLPANVELDDLIQAGTIGLWDAINNYDQSHNTMFETYASQRIRGAMLDELRAGDWAPRSLRSQMRSVESAMSSLMQKLGRQPKDGEVAGEMGISLEDYHSLLSENTGHQLVYLEDLSGDGGESGFLDHFEAGKVETPLEILMDGDFRAQVVGAIEDLPEKEKLTMSLYYEQDLNLKEIGAILGVTEARVSQLHSQAVARIRATIGGN